MVYRDKQDFDEGDLQTGTRVCKSCFKRKDMPDFPWNNGGKNRRRVCTPCISGKHLASRQQNRDRYRLIYRLRDLRKYGLTPESFEDMMKAQNGACAICLGDFGESTPHIDHDHRCCPGKKTCGKCVRLLLCRNCNTALGLFKDDPARILRAYQYVMEDA